MYNNYINYLSKLDFNFIESLNFKSDNNYCGILEHVSYDLGLKYLILIEYEFPQLDFDVINEFVTLNDKYGNPIKYDYEIYEKELYCSPTSLRYIYHANLILNYYKKTGCKNIVEVGCGYGGLCLAIQFFSNRMGIKINNYNLIDFSEVGNLIKQYLSIHKSNIFSIITIHDCNTYGKNVRDDDLFFISNYCLTEIDTNSNNNYVTTLLPKTKNGFITWQNGGNGHAYPIESANKIINKNIINIEEEKPQTDSGIGFCKNYFVYF